MPATGCDTFWPLELNQVAPCHLGELQETESGNMSVNSSPASAACMRQWILVSIGWDGGSLPGRPQAITWTNTDLLQVSSALLVPLGSGLNLLEDIRILLSWWCDVVVNDITLLNMVYQHLMAAKL